MNREAIELEWDFISQSNLQHLSCILFSFLSPHAYARVRKVANCELQEYVSAYRELYEKVDFRIICSGSVPEGFLSPPLVVKGQSTCLMSDLDVMFARSCDYLIDDTDPDVHKGYVNLVLRDPQKHDDRFKTTDRHHKKVFLKSTPFIEPWQSSYKSNNLIETDVSGPSNRMTTRFDFESIRFDKENDRVTCLSFPKWPDQATEWLDRHRASDWPPQSLIGKIRQKGCHFVPMPHHESKNPDIEWRFSFSEAELFLSQSLTEAQRQCYVILKMFCKFILKDIKLWKTYFLKTVFFWSCEKLGTKAWTPINLAKNLFALIDELVRCLIKREIKHYFLPENNLISHLDAKTVTSIINALSKLRRAPLQCMLEWQRSYYWFETVPFMETFGTIYEEMNNPHAHSDLLITEHLKTVIEKMSKHYLLKGQPMLSLTFIKDYQLFFENGNIPLPSESLMSHFRNLLVTNSMHFRPVMSLLGMLVHFSEIETRDLSTVFHSILWIDSQLNTTGLQDLFLNPRQNRRKSYCTVPCTISSPGGMWNHSNIPHVF